MGSLVLSSWPRGCEWRSGPTSAPLAPSRLACERLLQSIVPVARLRQEQSKQRTEGLRCGGSFWEPIKSSQTTRNGRQDRQRRGQDYVSIMPYGDDKVTAASCKQKCENCNEPQLEEWHGKFGSFQPKATKLEAVSNKYATEKEAVGLVGERAKLQL